MGRVGDGLARGGVAVALALVLAILLIGCGSSDSAETSSGGGGGNEVTLTIGTRGPLAVGLAGRTAEEVVLGEIYAQALEGAGYTVRRKDRVGFEIAEATEALEAGEISGYPDHLDDALTAAVGDLPERVPADAQKAYGVVRRGFRKLGLTALPPTPFSSTYAVGALRKTAEERGWKTVSDLEGQSKDLTISGVTGCHAELNCVGGLEALYGLYFAGFIYKSSHPTEPFEALETGYTPLSMVPNTDGRLAAEKDEFVTLEDDKHLFPAGNAIFVTTPKVVEEAGPEFEKTIVAAQKGLTLPVIQQLDAKVELEHQTPAVVAAAYLKQVGLPG